MGLALRSDIANGVQPTFQSLAELPRSRILNVVQLSGQPARTKQRNALSPLRRERTITEPHEEVEDHRRTDQQLHGFKICRNTVRIENAVPVALQMCATPSQMAQLANRWQWDETFLQQPVFEQLRNNLAVLLIGFVSLQCMHVLRMIRISLKPVALGSRMFHTGIQNTPVDSSAT